MTKNYECKVACDCCGTPHDLEVHFIYLHHVAQFEEELLSPEPNQARLESLRTVLNALQQRFPWLVEQNPEYSGGGVDIPVGEA
jgi:hypothetical protein